jgi:ABC-type nitrate/sulfonate/bicarbonate transport system permease component
MALRPLIKGLLGVATLLVLWQTSIVAFKIPSYILPSPAEVARAFITSRVSLTEHTVFTIVSALVGLAVSCSLAVLLAIAFVTYKPVARISMPLVIAFRSAPVTAVAPLIMLFVGRGLATSVVVIVIVSFFPILVNMMRGLLSADQCALELLHVYGASRWQQIRYVRAPYSLPFLFTGLRVAAASAVLGAMLSEWITGAPGLGVLILESGVMREIELLWAAVLTSVVFALILFFFTSIAERMVLHWKGSQTV